MELRLLGPLEVRRNGNPVPLGGPKQRAVLAHLLVHANQVVSTDRLIDEIWGEEPPEAARNALQSYVSRLRSVLGDKVIIEAVAPGYRLVVEPWHIDVSRFEELCERGRVLVEDDPDRAVRILRDALDEWRGTPIANLEDNLSLAAEVARLEELRRTALENRIQGDLALGRHSDVITELEALTQAHPFRERLWHQLMLALYRSGRQADALVAFQRARSVLVEQLGLDPSPELQVLEESILRQDPVLELEGQPIRGYRLLEKIGEGEFGTVHRAVQRHVGREVAVKTIQARWADDPAFIRRFDTEAHLVARLEHPRIVPLYDYWREPGSAHLVMRWLRGGNLAEAVADGGLEPDLAVELIGQVAAGLSAAHRQGVVHRDVKAANILLDEEGNAYLSDFGIATAWTRTGAPDSLSSPYLSPEELRGEPSTLRSDVYSLGIVLYETLTGDRSWTRRPGSFSLSSGAVPHALERVISKATAADPADRFEDAAAFARGLAKAGTEAPVGVAPISNPYKGIRPFEEADANDFFGREAVVARLVSRLGANRFIALVGASGSGKSSMIKAGLLPAVRSGALEGSASWFLVTTTPGPDLMRSLEAALVGIASEPPGVLRRQLYDEPGGLVEAANQLLPDDGSELVLFVDQFEEVFGPRITESERARYLTVLATAATHRASRVRVLVALRADFYDRPLAHPEFAELLRTGTETVVPPTAEELESAITRPAEAVGVRWDRAVVAGIIAEMVGQPAALPALQYALTELFERKEAGEVQVEPYHRLGGVSGAMARRAEALYAEAGATGQQALQQLFLHLVDIDGPSQALRRRLTRRRMASLDVDQEALGAAVQAFGEHRLLSFDRDPDTREPTVELAHEALLASWSRLAKWVEVSRGDVETLGRLASARQEWERAGQDPSYLLGGARLEVFEEWAATSQVAPTREDLEYLEASRVQREAQRQANDERLARERELEKKSQRRLRALVAVFAMAAVVATTVGVYAFNQRETARRETAVAERVARLAISRELAAAAVANIAVDPDLAIHLAVAAVETTREPDGIVVREAEEALHTALQATRIVYRLSGWGMSSDVTGRYLAVSDLTGVNIYEPAQGIVVIRRLEVGETVALALGPSAETLAIATADGSLEIWDTESSNLLVQLDSTGVVDSLEYGPEGEIVAGVTRDGEVVVWDVASGAALSSTGAEGAVAVAFSPDGTILAIPHDGGTVLVDPRSGQELGQLAGDGRNVAFSPNGRLLATTGLDGLASIWELASRERLQSLDGHVGHVQSVTFNRDGSRVATGGHDGNARVWDTSTGEQLLVLPGQQAPVNQLAFLADGRQLVGAGIGGTLVWEVSPSGSREVMTIEAHDGSIFNVTYSPDGDRLATAGLDGVARIWDVATGDLEVELTGHDGPVADVVFSPDGSLLATASFDGTARIWNSNGNELSTLEGHTAPVWGASFSSDGSRLVTVSEDTTGRLWDVITGRAISELIGHEDAAYDVAWSPDKILVVTVSNDFTARLWDAATSTQVGVLAGHEENIVEVAFSPDGSRVATAGFDGARVWDVETRQEVSTLTGHGGIVLDVETSPDGTRWATSSTDKTARLWDAEVGRELLVLRGADGSVARLAFSPDGSRLATVGDEGLVRIYALDVDELVTIAQDRISRPMTEAECLQYLHSECS